MRGFMVEMGVWKLVQMQRDGLKEGVTTTYKNTMMYTPT